MDTTQRVRAILSFIQAADHGSFAAAARVLGISAAAVSKNVANLEAALGIRLMNRTTRTLSLTEEGAIFLRQARIGLDALELATDSVVAARSVPTGRVRISTSVAFGHAQLAPVLPGLLEKYPGLSVEVDFDDRVVDLVHDGYDIAIRGGTIVDSSLVSRRICSLNLVLVAAPDYLHAHGIPQEPEDLLRHRLIARKFLGGRIAPWRFKAQDGTVYALDVERAVLTLTSPETVAHSAVLGGGIAVVGVHHVWEHLQQGRLKVLLWQYHDPGSFELTLQYPHRAWIAPRVRVTVDYLLHQFQHMDVLHVPLASLAHYSA